MKLMGGADNCLKFSRQKRNNNGVLFPFKIVFLHAGSKKRISKGNE